MGLCSLEGQRARCSIFSITDSQISALANADQTIKAVFDDFTIVMNVLNSQDLKAEMAVRLMDVFSVAATDSKKGRIAEASNQLVSQAALKSFKPKSLH